MKRTTLIMSLLVLAIIAYTAFGDTRKPEVNPSARVTSLVRSILREEDLSEATLKNNVQSLTDNELVQLVKAVDWRCAGFAIFRELVFDPDRSLEVRTLLTFMYTRHGTDELFGRKVLNLDITKETDALKLSLLKACRNPGSHRAVTDADIRNAALDKNQSDSVRESAVNVLALWGWLAEEMRQSKIERGVRTDSRRVDEYRDHVLNRQALEKLRNELKLSRKVDALVQKALGARKSASAILQGKLQRIRAELSKWRASVASQQRQTSKLSQARKEWAIYSQKIDLRELREKRDHCELELLYEYFKEYVRIHSKLPASLSDLKVGDARLAQSYNYYSLAKSRSLTRDVVLFSTKKVLTFGNGREVFVVKNKKELIRIDKSRYRSIVMDRDKNQSISLAPGMSNMTPVLCVIMGDGSIQHIRKATVRKFTRRNNQHRVENGENIVSRKLFEKLFEQVGDPIYEELLKVRPRGDADLEHF